MRRNWKIILLTGSVLLTVILLAVKLYDSGKREVLSQFREQQSVYAHHLAVHIDSFFLHHSWRLQELSGSVVRHDQDIGKTRAHNNQVVQMSGYAREEMIGRPVFEFLEETSRDLLKGKLANEAKGKIETYELSAIRKDGRKHFILEERRNLEVIGEAGCGLELVQLLKKLKPDMVILDISMPRLRGIEAIHEVKAIHPDLKILILTMHKDKEYLHQTISAGADGYLLKEDADTELFSAIETIRKGKIYVTPGLADDLVDEWAKIRWGIPGLFPNHSR